jgi:hypothetical protein
MKNASRASLFSLLILLFSFAAGSIARADLANSLKVEETLRARVESLIQVYDPRAKVVLSFEYKNFDSELPGMAVAIDPTASRQSIAANDFARVKVEILTSLDQVPSEVRDMIYRQLPFPRDHVAMKVSKLPQLAPEVQMPLDTVTFTTVLRSVFGETFSEGMGKSLKPALQDAMNAVANQTLLTFAWILTAALGGSLVIFIAFSTLTNARLLREFRQHFSALSTALSEGKMGGASRPTREEMTDNDRVTSAVAQSPSSERERSFENLPLNSLSELFADCYWCERDGYAAWLWQRLAVEQRKSLLTSLPFMSDYCAYIIALPATAASDHNHPYYLNPLALARLSQEDLAALVRQKPGLWHALSPLRQARLPLSLREKISALQASPMPEAADLSAAVKNSPSPLRKLAIRPPWSEISLADEKSIFENPDSIPLEFRPHLKSLVWLALREPEVIKKALGPFDARSLATAWIGPKEALSRLEEALPEKKLKLLQTYLPKIQPDRHSEAYLALVEEGLYAEESATEASSADERQGHEAA